MIEVPDWAGYLEFRDRFAEVTEPAYFPFDWLDEQMFHGHVRLFRTDNSAIIVELRRFPGGALDVHGLVAVGDQKEIVDELIPRAEEWAKERGCTAAVIQSRPGWQRVMKSSGYDLHQVTVRKEL
jgi:N-acyl-L-homoserine lactone synthetase